MPRPSGCSLDSSWESAEAMGTAIVGREDIKKIILENNP